MVEGADGRSGRSESRIILVSSKMKGRLAYSIVDADEHGEQSLVVSEGWMESGWTGRHEDHPGLLARTLP